MSFNELPIIWMHYKTTVSFATFLIWFTLQVFVGFALNALVFSYIISIAEGLTRIAFGNRIQFWSLWKKEVASSPAVAAQTVIAYIILPLFILYQVLIFMAARHWLGWWYPASTMIDPNVVATYFPWLATTGVALRASVTEECLFRAFPLAGAAWLGQRYNKRTLFIVIAFVVQCLIFGAAHANYPAQPAYARLIELIFVSAVFGFVYLRYGLLPGILSHFLFDFTLGAIPLFLVTGFGALVNKTIIILLGLIPLAILFVARIRAGSWHAVPAVFYNAVWEPDGKQSEREHNTPEITPTIELKSWRFYTSLAIGIIGLALFIGFAKFKTDGTQFTESITSVKSKAKKIVATKGITLDDNWTTLVTPATTISDAHRFIWQQKDGKKLYEMLEDNFLPCPGWNVRFVRFNGTIAQRAESYAMRLGEHDAIRLLSHHIIAEAPGASLDEGAARAIALDGVKTEFGMTPEYLQEVSAQASKQPARTDWEFNFKDKNIQLPSDAEARVAINLIGDAVSGYSKFVHVPEQWSRDWKSEQSIHQIINMICSLLMILLLIVSLLLCWRRFGISPIMAKRYFMFMIIIMIGYGIIYWCAWDSIEYQFNTQEPYYNQLFRVISSMVISLLFLAAASAGFIIGAMQVKRSCASNSRNKIIAMAASLGAGLAGLISLLIAYEPSRAPYWGNYSFLACCRPWTSAWLSTTFQFVLAAAGFILLLNLMYELEKWRWGKLAVIISIPLIAIVGVGSRELITIPYWFIFGLILGICLLALYHLLLRYYVAAAPIVLASVAIAGAIQQGIQALFPMALFIMIFASIVIAQLAYGWYYMQSERS